MAEMLCSTDKGMLIAVTLMVRDFPNHNPKGDYKMAKFYVHFIDIFCDKESVMEVFAHNKEQAEYEYPSTSHYEVVDILDEQEQAQYLSELNG